MFAAVRLASSLVSTFATSALLSQESMRAFDERAFEAEIERAHEVLVDRLDRLYADYLRLCSGKHSPLH